MVFERLSANWHRAWLQRRLLLSLTALYTLTCMPHMRQELELHPVENHEVPEWKSLACGDFWEAVSELYLAYEGEDRPEGGENDIFATTLAALMAGDVTGAESTANDLWRSTRDPQVRERTHELLLDALVRQSKWRRYIEVSESRDSTVGNRGTRDVDSSTVHLVEAFLAAPPEQHEFPPGSVIVPIEIIATGHLLLEVRINGKSQRFILDTGASYTALASDIAEECGVKSLPSKPVYANSASGKVEINPAIMEELSIGNLVVRNHPVIILNEEDLIIRFGFLRRHKIDGVIGWNLIRHFRCEIDGPNRCITLARPAPQRERDCNLVLPDAHRPIVRLRAADGTPLNFFLDTGAMHTFLWRSIYDKLPLSPEREKQVKSGGAGGVGKEKQDVLEDFSVYLDTTRVYFPEIFVHPDLGHVDNWIHMDGVLGISIINKGVLIIDVPDGRCEVKALDTASASP